MNDKVNLVSVLRFLVVNKITSNLIKINKLKKVLYHTTTKKNRILFLDIGNPLTSIHSSSRYHQKLDL